MAACTPGGQRGATSAFSGEPHAAPQHPGATALGLISPEFVHLLARYVLRYQKSQRKFILGGLGMLKTFPYKLMVIVPLLYALLASERFPGNALSLESGKSLCCVQDYLVLILPLLSVAHGRPLLSIPFLSLQFGS